MTLVLWTIGGLLLWALLSLPLALVVGRALAAGSALPAPAPEVEGVLLQRLTVAG